ncbi:MAG: UTP--glucose-1-phosphate uridylyltransferase [Candidatus Moraniibacteriota bacterium]
MRIKKAILPVAGFGTRFLPATKAQPKEMLPVLNKPAVQYVVESVVAAGIEEIIFVTGRGKRAIEDHFDIAYELEDKLAEKNKTDLLEELKKIQGLAKFSYVRQSNQLGDGHAILQAAHLVGDEPVAVVFGDTVYDSKVPIVKQLIDTYEKYNDPVVGLTEVAREDVHKFGVYTGVSLDSDTMEIKQLIEKPKNEEAPALTVAIGAYIITPEVFEVLSTIENGNSGEIRLIDAFEIMMKKGKPLYGKTLEGTWLDTGDPFNLLRVSIYLGLKHPEIGDKLRNYLKTLKF